MRTTLDIGDDVLMAARELARREKKTAGQVLTELARKGLLHGKTSHREAQDEGFLGFQPLPDRGVVITNELINRLRDEELE